MSTRRPTIRIPGFGAWLRSQILARGLNQNEFASKVGVGRSTVSRWVQDQQPSGEYIDAIADVLVLDYDLVATKAGYRPAIQEVPASEREARAAELVRRIDWDQDDIALRMVMANLEELAETFRKKRSADEAGKG